MIKNFVLDTNVMLHDPNSLFAFEDNCVIVPIYTIEEIDTFKRHMDELGRAARTVSRTLDELRKQGPLTQGVPLKNGGTLKVLFASEPLPGDIGANKIDDKILAVALELKKKEPERRTILVSQDINLRIRADALGLEAVSYDRERIPIDELFSGTGEMELPTDDVQRLFKEGSIELDEKACDELLPNQFLTIRDAGNEKHTALARVDCKGKKLNLIRDTSHGVWGIKPRNREQRFAFDALLDDGLMLVTLVGKAGTGKTLLALAAGLQKVVEEKRYVKLLVARPIYPLGRDLGYLPGDIEEKLNPWMKPIYDNVELLLGLGKDEVRGGRSYKELFDMGAMELEPLTYIRGRSIPNQYILVDEAQNLTPHEVKTIITRAGDNTKIVLTGDPYQIDNPYLDSSNNGLTYVVNRFKGDELFGHVKLYKGERSPLAERAANLL